jgi:hypothetical protein
MAETKASEKYREICQIIEDWQIKLPDLELVLKGEKTLTKDAVISWSHLSQIFNRESFNFIKQTAKETNGFKIILSESSAEANLSILKKSLLYSDLIVIYSGSPTYNDFPKNMIDGVLNGGIINDGVIEWFRDLIIFKPLLLSGYGLCVQRHYYDHNPESDKPRWILTDMKNRGDRTILNEGASTAVNPLSLYFDLVSPSTFDCIFSGNDFNEWKGKLLSTFKSITDTSFGTLLKFDLPFLDNISLDLLIKIKQDEPEAFNKFRLALKSAVSECIKFDVQNESIENLSKHIYSTYIEPELETIKKKLNETMKMKTIRRSGAGIKFLSLTFNALLGNPIGLLIDSLSLGHTGIEEIFLNKKEKQSSNKNELYLLWKLKQISEHNK